MSNPDPVAEDVVLGAVARRRCAQGLKPSIVALAAGDSFQDGVGGVDAVGDGAHQAGGGYADVAAGAADGGDDQGGGESVAVPLFISREFIFPRSGK